MLEVDADERVAWVEPGVLNLDLSREVAHLGLHYAPDPSSQQACTIGGNVATNAGGPALPRLRRHRAHVLAVETVLPDGSVTVLGGLEPDQPGFDLRGCFVGSEGTMGIATRIAVRLTPNPPTIATLLLDFLVDRGAAATVTGIIAGGIVPAALEMMDGQITRAVEDFVGAGYPRDAEAVLLVELDGLADGVAAQSDAVARIGREHGARTVRSRRTRPNARCCGRDASRRSARSRASLPTTTCTTRSCPRTRLVDVLRRVYEIASTHDLTMMNVFHAGDGNLHPLIAFDRRNPACGSGCTTPGPRSSRRASRSAECSRVSTGSGSRNAI